MIKRSTPTYRARVVGWISVMGARSPMPLTVGVDPSTIYDSAVPGRDPAPFRLHHPRRRPDCAPLREARAGPGDCRARREGPCPRRPLTPADRAEIFRRIGAGEPIPAIAAAVGRNPSVIDYYAARQAARKRKASRPRVAAK